MGVSKVVYGGKTLVDMTSDTVTPETLAEGTTAHSANGEKITGVAPTTAVLYTAQTLTDEQKEQARQNMGVDDAIEASLQEAKDSGEFDGPPGASGVYLGSSAPTDPSVNVWIDPNGDATNLMELMTEADIKAIVNAVVAALPVYNGEVADA